MACAISRLPDVKRLSPDETAVGAAALYHEAAWRPRIRQEEARRQEVLVRQTPDTHSEQSAMIMEASLGGIVDRDSLDRAVVAVRSLGDRHIESLEGQIVAEADNLDEFGLVGLWTAIRRGALDGKGVQSVIDTWHRRNEYQFWTARLNDSFRFAAVRKLAEARLAEYERLMEVLEDQHRGADIEEALSKALLHPAP